MITSRGWWFLLAVLALIGVGVARDRMMVVTLGLTLLLWFVAEGLVFAFRLRFVGAHLRFRRRLHDEHDVVESLWRGRVFRVEVEVESPRGWLPCVRVVDRLPYGVQRVGTDQEACEGRLGPQNPLRLAYDIRCPSIGVARFEGVAVTMVDLQGFFCHYAFLGNPAVFRILPVLVDAEGRRPVVKRTNLLPSPGQHRHLRAGSGSELLNLRDYLPGDPPKTIAWKVSARRDRLITKEFESEVPLRCTLFVDIAQSVRVGFPGNNLLGRLVEIGCAVVQATAAARDLIGLCLVDDVKVERALRPARTSRHVGEVMKALTDSACLSPVSDKAVLADLVPLAYAFAEEVYPRLLKDSCNRVPLVRTWLWPLPHSKSLFRSALRLLGRLPWWVLGAAPLAIVVFLLAFLNDALGTDVLRSFFQAFLPFPDPFTWPVALGFAFSFLMLYWIVLESAGRMPGQFFFAGHRRLFRWRKRLAAILAERGNLGPDGLSWLLEDDRAMTVKLQEFLAEHQVPYPLPLVDSAGRYLFASPGKIEVLASTLLRAVAHCHDNELFVLLVDLLELEDEIEPLLRAVRVALARHHRVMLVCAWPSGALAADDAEREPETIQEKQIRQRWQESFLHLRRSFGRLGVPLVSAADRDAPTLILRRLEQLRSLGLGSKR